MEVALWTPKWSNDDSKFVEFLSIHILLTPEELKRIDLSYPIYPKQEITVVSMLSNNAQYWLQGSIKTLSKKTSKEIVLNKEEYTDKELLAIIGQKMKSLMNDRDDVLRTSRLYDGTKITISLNKLDNSDNLKDGHPSNTLFTYYVTDPEYFMRFEPATPQYKKLKNDTITFLTLTLKIMDQNNNIITDGPETTVVLNV